MSVSTSPPLRSTLAVQARMPKTSAQAMANQTAGHVQPAKGTAATATIAAETMP